MLSCMGETMQLLAGALCDTGSANGQLVSSTGGHLLGSPAGLLGPKLKMDELIQLHGLMGPNWTQKHHKLSWFLGCLDD